MKRSRRVVLFATLLAVVMISVACGGGGEDEDLQASPTEQETVASESPLPSPSPSATEPSPIPSVATEPSCQPVEEPEIPPDSSEHFSNPNKVLTAADFTSNPPAAGKHKTGTLEAGQVYTEP